MFMGAPYVESDANLVEPQLPPHPRLQHYYRDEVERRSYLDRAFDKSAQYYDRLSWLLGFGVDGWYRRQALLRAGLAPGMSMLDVGCGTGLSAAAAMEIVGPDDRIIGVEPSRGMLDEALRRQRLHSGIRGLAERLPVDDDTFDFVCMSFALRHVADLRAAFKEFKRVLKPGGRLLIVEMTLPPPALMYRLLRFYMKTVVPLIARLWARSRIAQELYVYCWETHDLCVPSDVILSTMRQVGLQDVTRWVDIGLFSEYTGRK
jgi:demethylmenaquinone methyltransferase/2-methoxy-6-polyprenyl-1,4-benzoquinol methylase